MVWKVFWLSSKANVKLYELQPRLYFLCEWPKRTFKHSFNLSYLVNTTRKAWRVYCSVFDLINLIHDNKLHNIYPMWHTCENSKASQSVICIFFLTFLWHIKLFFLIKEKVVHIHWSKLTKTVLNSHKNEFFYIIGLLCIRKMCEVCDKWSPLLHICPVSSINSGKHCFMYHCFCYSVIFVY